MKRIWAILLGIIMVLSMNGCGNTPPESEATKVEEIPASETTAPKTSPDPVQGISKDNEEQNPLGVPLVVSDIENWNHPIKKFWRGLDFPSSRLNYIKKKRIPLLRLTLWKLVITRGHMENTWLVLNEAARINGYWDYEVFNRTMDQRFEVKCDQKSNQVTSITVNGKAIDMMVSAIEDKKSLQPTEAQVMKYLMEQVPEIGEFNNRVQEYNKSNKTSGKPIMRIDSTPNSNGITVYEKDFYAVYVGESLDNHTNRWATFLVRKDFQEILVDDPATGLYITLQQWREDQIQ